MRRMLSVLMAVLFVVSIPMTALAVQVDTSYGDVYIDDTNVQHTTSEGFKDEAHNGEVTVIHGEGDMEGTVSVDMVSGKVTVIGDVTNGVSVSGDASVTVEGNVSSSEIGVWASGESSVTITGNVSGETDGVDANDSANITVKGNVTGGSDGVEADDEATVSVVGNVSGETDGVDADDFAKVTIEGNVSGGDDGIEASGESSVTITGDVSGGYDGVYASENATISVVGNVTSGNDAVDANDKATINVEGDVTGGDDGVEASNQASVTINGNVTGVEDGVDADGNASVTINGNVSGGDGDPGAIDYSDPAAYSDGGTGVDASDSAIVTVNGNVNGGDGYGTCAYGGSGIEALDNATVTVSGDVTGGDVFADPDTEVYVDEDGLVWSGRGGNGIWMSYGPTISVGGNVSAGSTNGDAGNGGSGITIEPVYEEDGSVATGGSVTVSGSVTSGSAENGEDGVGLAIIAMDTDDGEIPLPSISVGSCDSAIGVVVTEEDYREMTPAELESIIGIPMGESKPVADMLWSSVLGRIRRAQPGDEITVNVYNRKSMPASIIEAVREYDVKLIIKWSGGDDLVITKDFTADVSGTILLKNLAEMLKK